MEKKHKKFFIILGTQKGANVCLKCTKIRLLAGSARTRWGSLIAPPDRPTRNRGVLLLMGDTSIDWPQEGTTSLKYKAQRNVEFPIVPTFL